MKHTKFFLLSIFIFLLSCKNDSNITESVSNEQIETQEVNKLYQQALNNKNDSLIVWAGGDSPTSPNHWILTEWKKDFPLIPIKFVTDLSKFHNLKIDKELETKQFVTPDVAHLQTVDDFHKWRDQGVLEVFKPLNWDKIPNNIKDANGAFTPLFMFTFAHYINTNLVKNVPDSFMDYLKPEYKNNLILTYPHDDDAVLYLFKKMVDKYGWAFIDGIIAQNPMWIRGTAAPRAVVARGEKYATFGVAASFIPDEASRTVFPSSDMFLTWAQTGAIFKKSRHKDSAKLYMTWLLTRKMQEKLTQWSVRTDIAPKSGYLNYWQYPNTSPVDFAEFMLNRAKLEEFKQEIENKIGPVKGGSPLTDPDILKLL